MKALIVATPSPFRQFLIENNTNHSPTIVLEHAKAFKVSYHTNYRAKDINDFYKKNFTIGDENWRTYHVGNVNDQDFMKIAQDVDKLESIVLTGANFVRKKTLHALRSFVNNIVNIHFGDSDLYRGLDSNWWTLASNSELHPAVTLHVVDNGIDTGTVLKKVYSPMTFADLTLGQLLYFEIEAANTLLNDFLNRTIILSNSNPSVQTTAIYRSAMSTQEKERAVMNLLSPQL